MSPSQRGLGGGKTIKINVRLLRGKFLSSIYTGYYYSELARVGGGIIRHFERVVQ
jgi:hypothetical protein